jgi:Putative Ig domain
VCFLSAVCGALIVLLAAITPVHAAQSDPQSLDIVTQSPQTIVAGESFNLPLVAHGGFSPYTWTRMAGQLPSGLKLHPHVGTITGVATTPGEYHFTLAVTDSNIPHQQAQRDFTIIVVAGITLDWKQPPKVQGTSISGSAVVTNQTGHPVDLTVIVVAVNSIGRATALGYQHFTLAAQTSSPEIPFSSSPGPGTYYVRADAAAHRKSGHPIYRASKQTESKLEVIQF